MKTLIVIVLMMISTSCYALNYEIVKQQTAGYAVKTDDKCSIITEKGLGWLGPMSVICIGTKS